MILCSLTKLISAVSISPQWQDTPFVYFVSQHIQIFPNMEEPLCKFAASSALVAATPLPPASHWVSTQAPLHVWNRLLDSTTNLWNIWCRLYLFYCTDMSAGPQFCLPVIMCYCLLLCTQVNNTYKKVNLKCMINNSLIDHYYTLLPI